MSYPRVATFDDVYNRVVGEKRGADPMHVRLHKQPQTFKIFTSGYTDPGLRYYSVFLKVRLVDHLIH